MKKGIIVACIMLLFADLFLIFYTKEIKLTITLNILSIFCLFFLLYIERKK